MPKDDIYELVARRIREERKSLGLTLEELAEQAGISPSFLSYIESNRRKASLATVSKLGAALKIPLGDLFAKEQAADKNESYVRRFNQMIRDRSDKEVSAILDAAKAVAGALGRR